MAGGTLRIESNNSAVSVSLTETASGSVTQLYSDEACTTTVAQPVTVAANVPTLLYIVNGGAYTLSVKALGVEIAGGYGLTRQVVIDHGEFLGLRFNPSREGLPDLSSTYAPVKALSPGIQITNARGLRRFSCQVSDALFTRVPVVCVGDSVVFGQGSDGTNVANNTPDNVQGWVGQLRSLYAQLFGSPGEGYIFNSDPRVTFTGAQTGSNIFSGPLRHSTRLLNTQTYSITIPAGVTTLRVLQANNSGDLTGSYTKNAGGSVSLTTLTGTGTTIATDIAVTTGDAIVISGPATAQTYITGLVLINGTTGIATHRVGISGYVVGDAIGGQTSGALNLTSGQQTSAIKKLYDWEPTPGLLILSFGLNDQSFNAGGGTTAQNGVTAALYQTWMQAICTQAVADGWCVLLVGQNRNPSPGSGDTEAQYQAARKAIALATDHVAAVELSDIFGSAANQWTQGITVLSNSVHPSRKGHGYYARLLFNLLTTPFGDSSPTT